MGIFKTITGFLFGGSDHAGKTLDMADKAISGVGEWIDNKTYTEEEKAKDLSAAARTHLELIKATANENSARSVTRRVLAWSVTGFILSWASVAMGFAIAKEMETVKNIIEVAKAFWLGEAFVSIMVFYFGVQFVRSKSEK